MRRATIASLLLFCASAAWAHDPMSSWAVVRLYPDRFELSVELASESAWRLLGEPATSPPNIPQALPRLTALAGQLYEVEIAGTGIKPRATDVQSDQEDGVRFVLVYPRPAGEPFHFHATFLQKLPPEHRSALTLKDERGRVLRTQPLSVNHADIIFAPSEKIVSVWGYGALGVEHMITGFDHLLFLFALLVACRRWASMVGIITCFTVAHSVTLGLAAAEIVTISSGIIEPLIAASIVFVGVENLWRGDEPRGRWALTLGFGLIHGFGFAVVLQEIGVGSDSDLGPLLVALFSFNLGVELGQLAVMAMFLPLLWHLRKWPSFMRYDRPVISVVVVLAGLYWLAQRLL